MIIPKYEKNEYNRKRAMKLAKWGIDQLNLKDWSIFLSFVEIDGMSETAKQEFKRNDERPSAFVEFNTHSKKASIYVSTENCKRENESIYFCILHELAHVAILPLVSLINTSNSVISRKSNEEQEYLVNLIAHTMTQHYKEIEKK